MAADNFSDLGGGYRGPKCLHGVVTRAEGTTGREAYCVKCNEDVSIDPAEYTAPRLHGYGMTYKGNNGHQGEQIFVKHMEIGPVPGQNDFAKWMHETYKKLQELPTND